MQFPARATVRIGRRAGFSSNPPPSFEDLTEAFYAGYHGTVHEDDVPRGMCQWAFRMGRKQRKR